LYTMSGYFPHIDPNTTVLPVGTRILIFFALDPKLVPKPEV
jgi:hypothetical protein